MALLEDIPLLCQGLPQYWTQRGWALAWAVPWIPSPPADAKEEGLGIIDGWFLEKATVPLLVTELLSESLIASLKPLGCELC